MKPIGADDSGAALREAVERYRASKPDTAEPPKPAKGPRQLRWGGPISEIPGYPVNDIHGPPPEPPPVRLETAPGGLQLRKVARDTASSPTTEQAMELITNIVADAIAAEGARPSVVVLPDHPITETDTAPAAEDIKAELMTSWRDLIKVHPAADTFPMMDEPELRVLGEDIKANGLTSPITLWCPQEGYGYCSGSRRYVIDGPFLLLDGRNRLDAMELVGIPVVLPKYSQKIIDTLATGCGDEELEEFKKDNPDWTEQEIADFIGPASAEKLQHYKDARKFDYENIHYKLLFEKITPAPKHRVPKSYDVGADPVAYVISANIHRRHLSTEDRKRIAVVLLKANPQRSNRAIADEVQLDDKTVAQVRKDGEARSEIPHVETRSDSKGRAQPAAKPKKAKKTPEELAARADAKAAKDAEYERVKEGVAEYKKAQAAATPPKPAVAEPTAPEQPPANEPAGSSTSAGVLLDTFHKLTPADQVAAMQLFWDVLSPAQKQQLREHVTAALPMDKLLTERWPSMSDGEKAGVHSFLAAEMAKFETVNRPAAPAAQNGAAAS
jgi:hypothetical protein